MKKRGLFSFQSTQYSVGSGQGPSWLYHFMADGSNGSVSGRSHHTEKPEAREAGGSLSPFEKHTPSDLMTFPLVSTLKGPTF